MEVTVADRVIRLGAGSYFGEMAMLTGRRRSADVTAVDDRRLSVLGQGIFYLSCWVIRSCGATLLEMAQRRGQR